jgi:hypothetical protein
MHTFSRAPGSPATCCLFYGSTGRLSKLSSEAMERIIPDNLSSQDQETRTERFLYPVLFLSQGL